MLGIIQFLKNICSAIVNLFTFVVNLFADLIYAIGLIGDFVFHLPTYLGWFPTDLLAWVTLMVSIAVVYVILGRK